MVFGAIENQPKIFDEVDIVNARSLQHAMLARLYLMNCVALERKIKLRIDRPRNQKEPQNRDQEWAMKFLKGRKSWY